MNWAVSVRNTSDIQNFVGGGYNATYRKKSATSDKDLGQNLSNNAMRQQQDFMCILGATGKLN